MLASDAVSSAASGCKYGLFHVDAGDVEAVLDRFVVVQDRVVVVALELDRHERVLLARVRHVRQHLGALEVADRPQDLVGVVLLRALSRLSRIFLLNSRVVGGLALGRGVDRDDVSAGVPAVGAVGQQ